MLEESFFITSINDAIRYHDISSLIMLYRINFLVEEDGAGVGNPCVHP